MIRSTNGSLSIEASPKSIRELYSSPHIGTIPLTTKDALTEFAKYNISSADALDWANKKKLLREEFMFGINMSNVDNSVNFICTWNGVNVVDNVYARPGITGAPVFGANQNKVFDFTNEMRVQGLEGAVAAPRNHVRWRTAFNGTIDFGCVDEYSWGQNQVVLSGGVEVVWKYYLQGTGNITLYYDHLRVSQ